MRRTRPAYPAVGDDGGLQTDDNPSDVTRIYIAGWPAISASRPHL